MNPLEKIIRNIIASSGPMSLATYMELALQHPEYGYYRVREPLGRTGDFITAPEVSQMFGEMLGVWCVQAWQKWGRPNPFALIELGPGRGTMMRDILRATAHVDGFHAALSLYLFDSNQALRLSQRQNLPYVEISFIEDLAQLPTLPSLILANEFFDALPIRQFIKTFQGKTSQGWAEHKVVVEKNVLAVAPILLTPAEINLIPAQMLDAAPNTVVEISFQSQAMMQQIAAHLVTHHGSMLVIDYGYVTSSGAATLQAISQHTRADIFDRPGEVDLTAHVDFAALADAARQAGAQTSPVIGQGAFLQNMGIEIRAELLKKHATAHQTDVIDSELHRLIDADQMGELFKVMVVHG